MTASSFIESAESLTFYADDRLRIAEVRRVGRAPDVYVVTKLQACMIGVPPTRQWADGPEPEFDLYEALDVARRWIASDA